MRGKISTANYQTCLTFNLYSVFYNIVGQKLFDYITTYKKTYVDDVERTR